MVNLRPHEWPEPAIECELVIRDGRLDEAERVAALILESFAEFEDEVPAVVWEAARKEWADVRGRWQDSELIVAERSGELGHGRPAQQCEALQGRYRASRCHLLGLRHRAGDRLGVLGHEREANEVGCHRHVAGCGPDRRFGSG